MTAARSKIQTVNGTSVATGSAKDGDRTIRVLKVGPLPDNRLQVQGTAASGKITVACSLTTSLTDTLQDGKESYTSHAYKTQTEIGLSNDDGAWTIVFTASANGVYLITAHGDTPGTNDYLEVTVNSTGVEAPRLPHFGPLAPIPPGPQLGMSPIQAATPANVKVTGTVTYANNPVTCQATPVNNTNGTSELKKGTATAMASSTATSVTFNAAGTNWTATNFNPQLVSGTAYTIEASAANEGTVAQPFTPS